MAERDALQAAYACRESGNCLLCREAYLDGEDAVAYPCHTATKCPSVFHPWCASKWYDQGAQVACPLCRTGIIPDGMFPEIDLHALDGDGFGALHHACYTNRNPKVVEVLLKWGCNLEQKNQPFLERPLHFAALYRHEEHLRILLNAAAQVDATNYQGQSPMDYLKRESFMKLGGGNEQRCLELLESKVSSPAAKLLANRLREQGNAAFQQKDFFDAARAYTGILGGLWSGCPGVCKSCSSLSGTGETHNRQPGKAGHVPKDLHRLSAMHHPGFQKCQGILQTSLGFNGIERLPSSPSDCVWCFEVLQGCLWDSAREVEGAVVEVEEAELSKAQKRRERHRANRAAAAQRKDLQREKIAKEQFLRETAQGFTERQMPLEPTASKCKERKSKPTQAKDFAENELAEDLLMQRLRDELRARAVPFFEGARNPLQTASRNALQAVAQGAPYKPCSWCWKPALLDTDCPHCLHCCCDPFSAGPGALPRDYGVEWEDAEVPGLLPKHWKWFSLNDSLCLCPRTSPTRMMKYVILQQ